jgi:hypothetical protein
MEVKLTNAPQPEVTRRRASTQGVKGFFSCFFFKLLTKYRKHRMTRMEEQQKI